MPSYIGTAQPGYIRFAVAELRRIDPQLSTAAVLAGGVFRFATDLDTAAFAAALREREPVFVRHLHPVCATVALTGGGEDPAVVGQEARRLTGMAAVQVRILGTGGVYGAKEFREAAGGSSPVPATPDAPVLSVTIIGRTAYLGLSTARENLSDWPGGEVRFRREGLVSRAAFKLLEVFARYGAELVQAGTALDLGAAPGGWTQVLLDRGFAVTAVDTTALALAPALAGRSNLTFVQGDAKGCNFPPGCFDLITCDINWDPLGTARLVGELSPSLRPGGAAVLTVKLLHTRPVQILGAVEDVLAATGLVVHRRKQLFHNRDEVTLILRLDSGRPDTFR